ncbi:hypothetical protein PsorP6_013244 [Peronosclerospora sorghi]|uniref:Uncharacterized protein n=1 Tax=Peronosclerospora sorghi TaxID=230839 RepID=A0ACC0WGK9_9STRA|nr:hypothetical protein PsorP6_013244 [Peronosclerospora sorghi]
MALANGSPSAMRVYRGLILASLALVTELDSAAGSKRSTSTYNATLDSGHDTRVRTSGSALRVHETVDEDDEERAPKIINDLVQPILRVVGWPPSTTRYEMAPQIKNKPFKYLHQVFHVPEDANLNAKYNALMRGLLFNEELIIKLTKEKPDRLFQLLTEHFDELILSIALSHESAPEYVKTLRDKYFKRLVKQKRMPEDFVGVLRLQDPEFEPHSYTALQHFLEAFNKKYETEVSISDALYSAGHWETFELLFHQLRSDRTKDAVAFREYDRLAHVSIDLLSRRPRLSEKLTYIELKSRLEYEEVIVELTDPYQDLLVSRMGEQFDDLRLSLALTDLTFKQNAPKYLITLRDKHSKQLIDYKNMNPRRFLRVFFAYWPESAGMLRCTALHQFITVYNEKYGTTISVIDTLRTSYYWTNDAAIAKKLAEYIEVDPLAKQLYNELRAP